MSDKPMKVVRKTDNSVELRGFPIEHCLHLAGKWWIIVIMALLFIMNMAKFRNVCCMYDRNTFIEYRYTDKSPLKSISTNSYVTECEQLAIKSGLC